MENQTYLLCYRIISLLKISHWKANFFNPAAYFGPVIIILRIMLLETNAMMLLKNHKFWILSWLQPQRLMWKLSPMGPTYSRSWYEWNTTPELSRIKSVVSYYISVNSKQHTDLSFYMCGSELIHSWQKSLEVCDKPLGHRQRRVAQCTFNGKIFKSYVFGPILWAKNTIVKTRSPLQSIELGDILIEYYYLIPIQSIG